MDLVDLQCLIACTDAGGFGLAAKALGVDTSTLSRRIGHLEDELGLSLFERDRTGIRLTRGGMAVVQGARSILFGADEIRRIAGHFASGSSGELRLGVRHPPIGGVARKLLARWRAANSGVTLTIFEGNQRELALGLKEHRLDVALVTGHAIWPHVTAVPIFRERMMVALPSHHELAARPILDWNALRGETILVQGWNGNQTQREFYSTFLGSEAEFQVNAASEETIFALVGIGAGIALVTESQSEVSIADVTFRPIADANAWVDFGLVWRPEVEDPLIGRFVAFMRDESRVDAVS